MEFLATDALIGTGTGTDGQEASYLSQTSTGRATQPDLGKKPRGPCAYTYTYTCTYTYTYTIHMHALNVRQSRNDLPGPPKVLNIILCAGTSTRQDQNIGALIIRIAFGGSCKLRQATVRSPAGELQQASRGGLRSVRIRRGFRGSYTIIILGILNHDVTNYLGWP